MERNELLRTMLAIKDTGFGKKPVSIITEKIKQKANERGAGEGDGKSWRWPYKLIKGTPEGEELLEELGSCATCNGPVWDRYVGPSRTVYCGSECAWNAEDVWEQCVDCGKSFDYFGPSAVPVEEPFCSLTCFWNDLIKGTKRMGSGSWPGIVGFFIEHPGLDVDRLIELKGVVDPWEFIESPRQFLNELYDLN